MNAIVRFDRKTKVKSTWYALPGNALCVGKIMLDADAVYFDEDPLFERRTFAGEVQVILKWGEARGELRLDSGFLYYRQHDAIRRKKL